MSGTIADALAVGARLGKPRRDLAECRRNLASVMGTMISPAVPRPGDTITLGFDGGKADDDTALVAYRAEDNTAFVFGH